MHTLVAYRESLTGVGAYELIDAVSDPHVFVTGADIRVPEALSNIGGAFFMVNGTAVDNRGRLSSPSLRSVFNLDFDGLRNGTTIAVPAPIQDYFSNPIPLLPAEALNAEIFSDEVGAVVHKVLVWLVDGPATPIAGPIYSARFTATPTATDSTWVNGAITFTQTLPVGRYQVVGMRVRGAALTAARLVFVGGIWRPGCLAHEDDHDASHAIFRNGRLGVWGEFHTNAPPTLDVHGGTAAAFVGHLDLIRVG